MIHCYDSYPCHDVSFCAGRMLLVISGGDLALHWYLLLLLLSGKMKLCHHHQFGVKNPLQKLVPRRDLPCCLRMGNGDGGWIWYVCWIKDGWYDMMLADNGCCTIKYF